MCKRKNPSWNGCPQRAKEDTKPFCIVTREVPLGSRLLGEHARIPCQFRSVFSQKSGQSLLEIDFLLDKMAAISWQTAQLASAIKETGPVVSKIGRVWDQSPGDFQRGFDDFASETAALGNRGWSCRCPYSCLGISSPGHRGSGWPPITMFFKVACSRLEWSPWIAGKVRGVACQHQGTFRPPCSS